jgi:hypothetical protein
MLIISSKNKFPALLAFIFSFFITSQACAKETSSDKAWETSAWTRTHPYFNQIGHKLGFGILNLGTGWMALFQEPFRPGGFFKGFVRGIAYTVIYEAGGGLHAVTFPIPVDIPLPRGGLSFED